MMPLFLGTAKHVNIVAFTENNISLVWFTVLVLNWILLIIQLILAYTFPELKIMWLIA